MNYDQYLENQREFFEGSESAERLWVVVYHNLDGSVGDWSHPISDKYNAETEYWRAHDAGENVEFGYTYEGRFTSRWSDNVNEFNPVRL